MRRRQAKKIWKAMNGRGWHGPRHTMRRAVKRTLGPKRRGLLRFAICITADTRRFTAAMKAAAISFERLAASIKRSTATGKRAVFEFDRTWVTDAQLRQSRLPMTVLRTEEIPRPPLRPECLVDGPLVARPPQYAHLVAIDRYMPLVEVTAEALGLRETVSCDYCRDGGSCSSSCFEDPDKLFIRLEPETPNA